MDMMKLRGVIQSYPWGDSSYIPSLLGRSKTGKPQAELWMGSHPNGMSTLLETGEPLDEYIASHSEQVLGTNHLSRYGTRFPFLLKILSIETPLSLQVHPDSLRAEQGFLREQSSENGIRTYSDPYQKDEVLYALDEVTALAGFRDYEEAISLFREILDGSTDVLSSCEDLEHLFTTLLHLEMEERNLFLGKLEQYVKKDPQVVDSPFLSAKQISQRLLELYPDDIMAYAPFLLRLVHLRPTEALQVRPGMLHAYVSGHAVEVMSSSDNVLRGGLTPKHVNVHELLEVLTYAPFDGKKVRQEPLSLHTTRLLTDSSEFDLMVTTSGHTVFTDRLYIEIVCVLEGEGTFTYSGRELRFRQGDIILIPASITGYDLDLRGRIVSATVGDGEQG